MSMWTLYYRGNVCLNRNNLYKIMFITLGHLLILTFMYGFFFLNLELSHDVLKHLRINNLLLFMLQTPLISFLSECLVGLYGVNCL